MKPGHTLSSEEVAELQSALSVGDDKAAPPTGQVQPYDFRHHDKLPKQSRRALQSALDDLAHLWTGTGIAVFRTEITATRESLAEIPYGEFAAGMSDASMVYTVELPTITKRCLIQIPGTLGHRIVDRMSGGDGSGSVSVSARPLSEVERNVVECFLRRLVGDLSDAWHGLVDAPAAITGFKQNRALLGLDDHDTMVVAAITWRLHGQTEVSRVAIPVDDWNARFGESSKVWIGKNGQSTKSRDSLSTLVESIELTATVQLGTAKASVRDILGMDVGDVVVLDGEARDTLDLKIGGEVTFKARPGTVGSRLSVKIVDRAQGSGAKKTPADIIENSVPKEQCDE